ncbi:MAG: aminoglycoside phosphotransferase family protein [Allosphingosinicella sp.]|uniref:aminoglycoside phosphotransferase family protein n=1 Tax=Allosphingosinicella sp. TaxID=2823234 RepID=UPI003961A7DC
MEAAVDAGLAGRLVAGQFPRWTGLPVRPVEPGGWDHRMFRLGDAWVLRLPSALCYAPQVMKEHVWLPRLAPHLPLPVPDPVALGEPAEGFPFHWGVYRWLPGTPLGSAAIQDAQGLAAALAEFLGALQAIDAASGPEPGDHNFHRGGSLAVYDAEARLAITRLRAPDGERAACVWEAAISSRPASRPCWVHGDIAPGNLLIASDRLTAVIDFGCLAVGDPACDLAMAWSFFHGDARRRFLEGLRADPGLVARAKGWALWKAAVLATGLRPGPLAERERAAQVFRSVLDDPG